MKLIPLNQGLKGHKPPKNAGLYFAQVDDEDYEALMKYRWHVNFNKGKRTHYITRWHVKPDGKPSGIKMHRQIMGVTDPKIQVDHIDHNCLNCQKSNLREATRSQNAANRRSKKNGTSQYLGVCLTTHKYKRKDGSIGTTTRWVAKIRHNNKEQHIGLFTDEIEAAKAYDAKAKELHKEFANLNFKD